MTFSDSVGVKGQLAVAVNLLQLLHDLEFEVAKLAVGDDDEVPAAAGGVHEANVAELLPELVQLFGGIGMRASGVEFSSQFVEEEWIEGLEDVVLGGVVLA